MPLLLPAKKVFKSPYGIILRSMLRCTKPVLYTEIQPFLAGALHYAVASYALGNCCHANLFDKFGCNSCS